MNYTEREIQNLKEEVQKLKSELIVEKDKYKVLYAKWIGAEKFASWYRQEWNRLKKEKGE